MFFAWLSLPYDILASSVVQARLLQKTWFRSSFRHVLKGRAKKNGRHCFILYPLSPDSRSSRLTALLSSACKVFFGTPVVAFRKIGKISTGKDVHARSFRKGQSGAIFQACLKGMRLSVVVPSPSFMAVMHITTTPPSLEEYNIKKRYSGKTYQEVGYW